MHGCGVVRARRCAPLIVLAGLALATPAGAAATAPAGCPGADSRPTPTSLAATHGAVQCLVARARAGRRRAELSSHARLSVAAGAHAADMAGRGFLAHVSPDGETLDDRLRRAGWIPPGRAWSAGEVIARGVGARGTPRRVVRGWLSSPAHRRLLLGRATHLGVGVALSPGRAHYVGVVGRGGTPPALPELTTLEPVPPPPVRLPPVPAP